MDNTAQQATQQAPKPTLPPIEPVSVDWKGVPVTFVVTAETKGPNVNIPYMAPATELTIEEMGKIAGSDWVRRKVWIPFKSIIKEAFTEATDKETKLFSREKFATIIKEAQFITKSISELQDEMRALVFEMAEVNTEHEGGLKRLIEIRNKLNALNLQIESKKRKPATEEDES